MSLCRCGENRFRFIDHCSLTFERIADAYGNTLICTGPGLDGLWFTYDDVQSDYGANGIIFCGYRYDAESQLYYVRNRTYNPALGRWIQRDPIGYRQSANLYVACGDSPTALIDPTGTTGKSCVSLSYHGRLTAPVGLPAAVGFSVNINGEITWRVAFKRCSHCCTDGSWGEKYEIVAQIGGDITGTAYLGLEFHIKKWAEGFAGLSGSLGVAVTGSASDSWDTCRGGAWGKLRFCVQETITAELRGGFDVALHWGWFKAEVGAEVWLSGQFTDRACFTCGSGGCSLESVKLGKWSAEAGAKTCLWNGCLSWIHEFS